ncbi:MAG: hypothetical protein WBD00_00890 [Candidatus Omnitrophota bacterium]
MRARTIRIRKIRFFGLSLALLAVCYLTFQQTHWVKRFAENKVSAFLGNKLDIRIREISGGVTRDMTLQDVEFISGQDESAKVFRLERMEISYRLWRVFLERFGIVEQEEQPLEYVGIYFSDENPFVQGFVKIYAYPGKLELVGHVSPVLFGEEEKKGVKGTFFKREDGKYDCDLLWDGTLKIEGVLDPVGRSIDLGFDPLSSKKGTVKIKGSITKEKDISVYSRLDKVNLAGAEIIGDIWLSYRDEGMPVFLVKAENLVVNRSPFWDIVAGGTFSREKKLITIDKASWGKGFSLFGKIATEDPYNSNLKLMFRNVDLAEVGSMFGNTNTPLGGIAEGEFTFKGPLNTASVKGRLHVGEGVLGNMEFRSISASFEGKLPVIKAVDSRVMKDGGYIMVDGEIDFSKMREGKAFDGLLFETDNKVAVWEDWQISKGDSANKVRATRDKVTLSTSLEDDSLHRGIGEDDPIQNELGVNYKIDKGSSLKVQIEEDDDFFGLEHKIEF